MQLGLQLGYFLLLRLNLLQLNRVVSPLAVDQLNLALELVGEAVLHLGLVLCLKLLLMLLLIK